MTKFQMLAAAGLVSLAAACAGNQTAHTETRTAASTTTSSTARTTAPASTTATPAPAQQQAQATTPTPATPTPTTFTDDQLRSFARAAIEIDPISRNLTATATPEQQATATEQIRQILARNNLDSTTYNAIASQAQRDPAFASRIASLNRADQSAG